MTGVYDIGFTANLEEFYPMRYQHYSVIGAYGATYFRRSAYIYHTVTQCEGYFIRRKYWKIILDRNDHVVINQFKVVIENEFVQKISRKMNFYKLQALKRQALRADFQTIKYTQKIEDGNVGGNFYELRVISTVNTIKDMKNEEDNQSLVSENLCR